jgi:dTMP kinase
MHHLLQGRLIVFEGIDGTGKSTQLQLLAEELARRNIQVITTREPTQGPYGMKIRDLYRDRAGCSAEEELNLFIADRRMHVDQVVLPALQKGKVVLCDRYFLSTAAYQGANGLQVNEILAQNSFAPDPDLALIFEAPISVGIARITGIRGDVLNDFEKAESLAKVAEIFRSLDLPYIRRIEASESIETVRRNILHLVLPLLAPSSTPIPEPV